jgi:hypothetical protein
MVRQISSKDYKINTKIWGWLEYYQKAGGTTLDGYIKPWGLEEVLEINIDGKNCILITLDDDYKANINRLLDGNITTSLIRSQIIGSIFINGLNAEVVEENNIKKYLFTNMNLEELFKKYMEAFKQDRKYNTYEILNNKYFWDVGFCKDFGYDGFYDKKRNQITFIAFNYNNCMPERSLQVINFFHGKKLNSNDTMYMCSFDGDMKTFETMCDLIK